MAPPLPSGTDVPPLSRGIDIVLADNTVYPWMCGAPMCATGTVQGDNYFGGITRVGWERLVHVSPRTGAHLGVTRVHVGRLLRAELQNALPDLWARHEEDFGLILCSFRKTLRHVAEGRLARWAAEARAHPTALETFGWDEDGPPAGAPPADFHHAWAIIVRLYVAYFKFMPHLRTASAACYLLQLWCDQMLDLAHALVRSGVVYRTDDELQAAALFLSWRPCRDRCAPCEGLPDLPFFESMGTWYYVDRPTSDHPGRALIDLLLKASHAKCAFRALMSTVQTLFRNYGQTVGIVLDIVMVALLGNYQHASTRPGWLHRMWLRTQMIGLFQMSPNDVRRWLSDNDRLLLFSIKEYCVWLQSINTPFIAVADSFTHTSRYCSFVHALMDNVRLSYRMMSLRGMWANQALAAIQYTEHRARRAWEEVHAIVDGLRVSSAKDDFDSARAIARIREIVAGTPEVKNLLDTAEDMAEFYSPAEQLEALESVLDEKFLRADMEAARRAVQEPLAAAITARERALNPYVMSRHKISLAIKIKRRKGRFSSVVGAEATAYLLRKQEREFRAEIIRHASNNSPEVRRRVEQFWGVVREVREHAVSHAPKTWTDLQREAEAYMRTKAMAFEAMVMGGDPYSKKFDSTMKELAPAVRRAFGNDDPVPIQREAIDISTFPKRRYYLYPMSYDRPDPIFSEEEIGAVRAVAKRAAERILGGDGFVELFWLRVLGVSERGMKIVQMIYKEYEGGDKADHHLKKSFGLLWSTSTRDFMLFQRYFALIRHFMSRQVWFLPDESKHRQTIALRRRLGLTPYEDAPPWMGNVRVCHCGNVLAPVVSDDESVINSTASGAGGGKYSIFHGGVMCMENYEICQRPPIVMNFVGVVYVKNARAFSICTETGAVVEIVDQASWGTWGPRVPQRFVPSIVPPLVFRQPLADLISYPPIARLTAWLEKNRHVAGQAAVARSTLSNLPFDATTGWYGYGLDRDFNMALIYLAPDEAEVTSDYLHSTPLPFLSVLESIVRRSYMRQYLTRKQMDEEETLRVREKFSI